MRDSGSGGGFGCGWPYPHYEAQSGTVSGSGRAITRTGETANALVGVVAGRNSEATVATGGDIRAPTATVTRPAQRDARNVAAAAMVAGGCVVQWAHHITDHNTDVDGLNDEFSTEHENDFGVAAADYSDAKGAEGRAAVDSERSDAVAAQHRVRAAVYGRRLERLRDDLDEDAKSVAAMLKKGPTEDVVLQLLLAGALPPSALSTFPQLDLSTRDYRTLVANLRKYGELDSWLQGAGLTTSASMKSVLDVLRAAGVAPAEYKDLLQNYWLTKACEKAGIDLSGWDPSLGSDAMLPYLVASYEYYGKLYLDNPAFQWAGMAGMIGPTFAGGMFDLQMLEQLSDIVSTPLDVVPDWAKGAVYGALPSPLDDLTVLGEMSEHEFDFFENKFLSMQKQIFTDQMPMHEAYMAEGMDGIREMYEAGLIDEEMVGAWADIDSGDAEQVADGNEALLHREQYDIIGDDYDDMRDYHGPVGEVMTYVMGAIGAPGIPEAETLGQHNPVEFGVEIDPWGPGPHGGVHVETPFPDGNISDRDTRWDLIENDTLPTFQDLIENDPEQVEDILNGDVQDRIEDARLGNNMGDIIDRLAEWDVDVEGGLW